MFGMGLTELLVILAIILLVFGHRRILALGQEAGSAIRSFRGLS
jgi:TatA/E family protein of Tat protein translocase